MKSEIVWTSVFFKYFVSIYFDYICAVITEIYINALYAMYGIDIITCEPSELMLLIFFSSQFER